ncbi:MAG: type III-B CRISPR module-associated protein Cmr5 [Stygiobacter sp.]
MNNTNLKGLEEDRAKRAYDFAKFGTLISSPMQDEGVFYKDDKYSSYVKKIPMFIKTNGLGSTLAFVKSKIAKEKNNKTPGIQENPKNAYDLIYVQIKKWLVEKSLINANEELVEHIISLDSIKYRQITAEVLAFFNWLRRFAEGLDSKGE